MINELIGTIEADASLVGEVTDSQLEVNVTITETGPRGLQGIQGPKGDKGDTGEVDYSNLALKADITYVDSQDALKADKTEISSILSSLDDLTALVNNGFDNIQNITDDLIARVQLLEDGTEDIYSIIKFTINIVGRWDSPNVIPSLTQEIGRLEITNNNDEEISFIIYESYGHGAFAWTSLKTIILEPNVKAIEYVQLSGTRNNFVIQTRDANGNLVDTSDCVIEMIFSNKSNEENPTIVCP